MMASSLLDVSPSTDFAFSPFSTTRWTNSAIVFGGDDVVGLGVCLVGRAFEAEIEAARRSLRHQLHFGLVGLDDRVGEVGWVLGDWLQNRQDMSGRRQQLVHIARWLQQEGGKLLGDVEIGDALWQKDAGEIVEGPGSDRR